MGDDGMRTCSACGQEKSLEDFYRNPKTGAYASLCRVCRREYGLRYYQENKASLQARGRAYGRAYRAEMAIQGRKENRDHEKRLRATLIRKYGLTLEDYHAMLEAQGGGCAICHQPCARQDRLSVDHCHETGAVRALLCADCNSGLGLLGDNPDLLMAAAEYLRAYEGH